MRYGPQHLADEITESFGLVGVLGRVEDGQIYVYIDHSTLALQRRRPLSPFDCKASGLFPPCPCQKLRTVRGPKVSRSWDGNGAVKRLGGIWKKY